MGKHKETEVVQYDPDVPAHTQPFKDVLEILCVNQESGLSEDEAKKRKEKYGPNQLDEGPGVQPFRILVHQVANALTLVSAPSPGSTPSFAHQILGSNHGHGCFLCNPIVDRRRRHHLCHFVEHCRGFLPRVLCREDIE